MILKVDVDDIFKLDADNCGEVVKWFMRALALIILVELLLLLLPLLLLELLFLGLTIREVWTCLMRGKFTAACGRQDARIDDVRSGFHNARFLVQEPTAITGAEV